MAILCSVRSLWAACLLLLVPRLSCQSLLCSVSLVSEIAYRAASCVASLCKWCAAQAWLCKVCAPVRPASVWRWLNELISSLLGQACGLPPHDWNWSSGPLHATYTRTRMRNRGCSEGCAPAAAGRRALTARRSLTQFHSHQSTWRHNDSAGIKDTYRYVICRDVARRWAHTSGGQQHCLSWRAAAARHDRQCC